MSKIARHARAMQRQERQNQKALDAFLAKKAEFDALLADMAKMSADHFSAEPDSVHWGHVGDIAEHVKRMREVTDAYFCRGEYAE